VENKHALNLPAHGQRVLLFKNKQMTKTQTIQEKLQAFIDLRCKYAEENGRTSFSTCNHYNDDHDIWDNHRQIIDVIRSRGYNVSSSTNWGVLDVVITKKIELK